jgi:ankyrin repeat protein
VAASVDAAELHDAVNSGDISKVTALIAGGADVNQTDLSGAPLHLAVGKGDLAATTALVAAGADLEISGEPSGAHPLHVAAQVDEPAIALLLIDRGAHVDSLDGEGRTPLMVAATNGSLDTATVLLNEGANPAAEDSIYHDAPIHFAAWSKHADIVDLLLSRGVDVNSSDGNGETPLHEAATADAPEVVELLLAKGADPTIRDNAGNTPLQVARGPAAAELLRRHGVKG